MDNEVGPKNIANLFKEKYCKLYNRVELGPDFERLCENINSNVEIDSIDKIHRINSDLVKEALHKMKPGKADSLFSYSSDLLINGPQELMDHLVNLLRSIFVHGEVPHFLLLCTLVPLVKNNLADIASSENYRAIAIQT